MMRSGLMTAPMPWSALGYPSPEHSVIGCRWRNLPSPLPWRDWSRAAIRARRLWLG